MKKGLRLVAAYFREDNESEDPSPESLTENPLNEELDQPESKTSIENDEGVIKDDVLLEESDSLASSETKQGFKPTKIDVETKNVYSGSVEIEPPKNEDLDSGYSSWCTVSPPTEQPSLKKMEKVEKLYLMVKKENYNVNDTLRRNKEFLNPNVLSNLLQNPDLSVDESGTNYHPEVFKPQRFPKSDYYHSLLQQLKEKYTKKQQKRTITPLELAQALPNNKLSARTSNLLKMNMERNSLN